MTTIPRVTDALPIRFGRDSCGDLRTHGVGTMAEISDGAAPHLPRGCPAQAWSVAEVLRAGTILTAATEDA